VIRDELSIDDLAGAVGMTRRGVRFYVQAKLLAPPRTRGRGAHYGPEHLKQLQRIIELQSAGHSLEEIRRIFSGASVPAPPAHRRITRPLLDATLVSRLSLCEGVELSFDAARYQPRLEDLLQLKQLAQRVFGDSNASNPTGDNHARD
jgi:DNA-binding transcriptional MerR regulator